MQTLQPQSRRESKRTQSVQHPTLVACRPFLKWVGGKTQLLPHLLSRVPSDFSKYFEPFIGGGALFLALQPPKAIISDINDELINTYTVVRDTPEELIRALRRHQYDADYYYKIRDVDRKASYSQWSPTRRAARTIYLNKSCFNGLYRVNSQGHFNTPFGRYVNPTICDAENLRACSKALESVTIKHSSFLTVADSAKPRDFVYFDPPYVPLSNTSNFTGYSSGGFEMKLQEELFELCVALDTKGVKFMLSNSSAPYVLERYSKFNLQLVNATRAINSVASKRGKIAEVIVTNY